MAVSAGDVVLCTGIWESAAKLFGLQIADTCTLTSTYFAADINEHAVYFLLR